MISRCRWCGDDPLYVAYHDCEWGEPLHDERALFEFLILEGAQAGLSWISILRKRDNYRAAFDGFDPLKISRYGQHQVTRLLNDPGIVRNRLKIAAAINNAGKFLALQDKFGGFNAYLWGFVEDRQVQNTWQSPDQIPAQTPLSRLLSKDLIQQGFKFVGPTICYSLMQAVGLVNDHVIDCFRYRELNPGARPTPLAAPAARLRN